MSNYLSFDTTLSGRILGKEKLSKCRKTTPPKKGRGGGGLGCEITLYIIIVLRFPFVTFTNEYSNISAEPIRFQTVKCSL